MLLQLIESSPAIGGSAVENLPHRNPVCHITYSRDAWVKLIEPPSEYSFDQALLLCPDSHNRWIAWIPDHGEAILDRSEIYC